MTQVLQIIPDDGVGGAELAARAAVERQGGRTRLFVLDGPPKDPMPVLEHIAYGNARPGGLTSALRALKAARDLKPDVVVFSLWKTWLAFLLIKFFGPKAKLVTFLHSDQPFHVVEDVVSRGMMALSDAIWADSDRSLALRLPNGAGGRTTRPVVFLLHRVPGVVRERPAPNFVFWGRIKPRKGVVEAIRLIARIPDSRFLVIGPDGGEEARARRTVEELGLGDRVTFTGPRGFDDIQALARDSSFFLQLSVQEGMSMSTVEAMQMGLVPVVTPVGEIPRYCEHMTNAVLIGSEDQAVADVARILADPALFSAMSKAAVDRWAASPLYDEDFMAAAGALVAKG